MSDWRNYADQVDVAVLTVEDQLSEPVEAWVARFYGPPAAPEDFERDVQRLAYSEELRADRPHILTSRRTYYSWGADAVGWRQVLEVAAHYGDAALTALITCKFTEWWKKAGGKEQEGTIDKESARETAFWAILLAYEKVARSDLVVMSQEEARDSGDWVFEIDSPGHHFTVKVGVIKGLPTAVNIKCRFD